jgi:hypothetical protein
VGNPENSSLQARIEYLERKLQLFLKEEGLKTLELSFGTIKFRKLPDKIEITELNEFLKKADASMLNKIPESFKPDLNKIKAFIARTGRIPTGCTLIKGEVKFICTINKSEDQSYGKTSDVESGSESASDIRAAV